MEKAILSGLLAGIAMAAVSEIAFRLGLFRSSLVRVDALFVVRLSGKDMGPPDQAAAGWIIHAVTSSVFGAAYWIGCYIMNLNALSLPLFAAYLFLLYVSMLVTALPIAGQGFFGRKLGSSTWLEQLIIHVVFGIVFWWVFAGLYG